MAGEELTVPWAAPPRPIPPPPNRFRKRSIVPKMNFYGVGQRVCVRKWDRYGAGELWLRVIAEDGRRDRSLR